INGGAPGPIADLRRGSENVVVYDAIEADPVGTSLELVRLGLGFEAAMGLPGVLEFFRVDLAHVFIEGGNLSQTLDPNLPFRPKNPGRGGDNDEQSKDLQGG